MSITISYTRSRISRKGQGRIYLGADERHVRYTETKWRTLIRPLTAASSKQEPSNHNLSPGIDVDKFRSASILASIPLMGEDLINIVFNNNLSRLPLESLGNALVLWACFYHTYIIVSSNAKSRWLIVLILLWLWGTWSTLLHSIAIIWKVYFSDR